MRGFGASLGAQLRAGDLIVLQGPLGAGKTALTQGIGSALGFDQITSPTFVISRVHSGKLPLIHVDAYRLLGNENSAFEFDDLDLATQRESAVTIIEWGADVALRLGEDYLLLDIAYGKSDDARTIKVSKFGDRWNEINL
ncbi:MAG: tRNA (adenosine(37)-N6)-threonylcarbamoyltransferase complex ATPase subunit type 1 TsaE [Actinobacteria bacterium]|nr:tRNA (adenosine(37)-N6)-threonylcarbamoyltransferase complex ATPase subunit type 1 TsaE [Actinomycetota bacterium]MSV78265.1 tRNA (adenosine(37)-N6)-threonylcarbamoyltransferase complex ATPase subunit type 1 TsaE [Actinomycetota bacterium]MSW15826.1 tRNA (adenosine(37)-N6)-threonylcarbamoyltransferase complex ATPase subunit type 1 TsaE [Actinomycetota bacterium]MSX44237.1 tRNA (adenosine(37)-N6)-threonylcarbamoyltransferase complex ATPase subunit type 1 TsaE [Actinomycetota bacterium]MSY2345